MSARAGRSRFFIGLASLLLMIGFVAIFHSSQQQLDESRQLRLRCEQQQEALNTRLQAIIEHKFRIEKALESERREHLETKQHFEQKAKEQKDIHNKAAMESKVRYESLQQHYKLLQSEHNDLVEECTKTKETHLEQINGLERKIKSLLSQVQQTKIQHEKDVERWKVKYKGLEHEKQRLEVLVQAATSSNDYAVQRCKRTNDSLEKLIAEYKNHCEYQPSQHNDEQLDTESKRPAAEVNQVKGRVIEKNFNEQQAIGDDLYKIAIQITNNTNNVEMHTKMHESNNRNIIGDIGGDIIGSSSTNNRHVGAIINSVENFQIAPNLLMNAVDEMNNADNANNNHNNNNNKQVLQQPPPLHAPLRSSTASSPLKTPDRSSSSSRPEALHASVANPTSEKSKRSSTLANDRSKESGGRLRSKPIPMGVAPVPENFEALISGNNDNNNNNRYANVVDELSGRRDDPEQENGAHEVKDDINIGDDRNEGRDHLREVLDNVNNAAEDDTNNFIDSKGLVGRPKKDDNEDVEVIGGGGGGGGGGIGVGNKQEKADNLLEGDNKLINEVVGDQGKEAAFPDGMHLEEANEEDEDEDDYSNLAARQQEGAAVRN